MKKSDKINILHKSKGTYNLCRCFFYYHPYYWFYYILNFSDRLLFGTKENDFILNGFQIRKISDLKKIEINNDACSIIDEENQLLAKLEVPQIDLTSWKTVFDSLKNMNLFLIVEHEEIDDDYSFFYIGHITEVKDSFLLFRHFDADGVWYDPIEIYYREITSVTFNDRYSKTWQRYLSKKQNCPDFFIIE